MRRDLYLGSRRDKLHVPYKYLHTFITHSIVPCATDNLEIFVREDGERGVRTKVGFAPGQFVAEYEANYLATKEEVLAAEAEYAASTLYVIEVSPV